MRTVGGEVKFVGRGIKLFGREREREINKDEGVARRIEFPARD